MDALAAPLPLPASEAPKFKFSTQTVTPQMAATWLQQTDSRGADERAVRAYTRDMKANAWKLNGEPIIFSAKGRLLAGRARLLACKRAEAPFRTLVIEGIEDDTLYRESIDAVRKRTLGDILHIRQQPSGRQLAAALTIIWRYFRDDIPNAKYVASAREILAILDKNPEITSVSLPTAKEVTPDLPLGMGIALHHLMSRVDGDRANQFFQQLIDQPAGTPGALLRASLKDMAARGGRRVQAAVLALSIKAWNGFYEERELTVLRYSPDREQFPSIVGLEADGNVPSDEEVFPGDGPPSSGEPSAVAQELVAEYVFVTPEMAADFLRKNEKNRLITDAVVAKYKRDMIAGNWMLNGQTIKIGQSGRLLDGQHRCKAAHESGIGFPAIIVRNVDDDAFDTFDLGSKRHFNNILSERGEKSTGTLAAALKLIWLFEQGKIFDRAASPTNAELDDVMRRHPEIRQSVKLANRVRHVVAPALGVTLHYLFSRKDAVMASEFIDRLCDGQNLNNSMPVWHLRDRLLKDRASRKVKILEGERFALAVKAWNATREGRAVGTLAWRRRGPSRETFPVVV